MFENSKWICNQKETSDHSIYFRKSFIIEKQIKTATLYICALGLGVAKINGVLVTEDVLTTPFTRYDKSIIYQQYDVSNILKMGKNAIGVHCGNGFYNNNSMVWNDFAASYRGNVKLIVCLKIVFSDGTETEINSDVSWVTTLGSRIYNHMRQGEFCDARLCKKGYSNGDFDDTEWESVRITASPGGVFRTTKMPPMRVIKEIEPISICDGLYDFGINTSGWVKIVVKGEEGQKISIKYDECLNDEGELKGHINKFNVQDKLLLHHEDIFICSGVEESYSPKFCYHGFRYVKIENAPKNIKVVLQVVHTDIDVIGDFECDNELIQKIHNCTVNSIRTNFHGIPTDCPHREQNGWTGDAQLSCEAALMNLDMLEAYRKWLYDFKDVQRESGQLPGIIPTSNWGYNFGSGPAWDCALFVIPWNVYLFTGDKTLLSEMWDNMNLCINHWDSLANNGIIDFGLGDWCYPVWEKWCPVKVTSTAYYYYCLNLMSKISKVLGKQDLFSQKASYVKNAWRKTFLNDSSLYKFQTYYACAIYMNLIEENEKEEYAIKLKNLIIDNDYRFDCGILGIKFIFTALSECGYAGLIFRAITNPKCPSYAYWINNGATSLCETWSMDSSNNHHMFSEVDNWFYKYIAGIQFTENGVLVKPLQQNFLNKFIAKHRGITVRYENNVFEVSSDVKITFMYSDFCKTICNEKFRFDVKKGEYYEKCFC